MAQEMVVTRSPSKSEVEEIEGLLQDGMSMDDRMVIAEMFEVSDRTVNRIRAGIHTHSSPGFYREGVKVHRDAMTPEIIAEIESETTVDMTIADCEPLAKKYGYDVRTIYQVVMGAHRLSVRERVRKFGNRGQKQSTLTSEIREAIEKRLIEGPNYHGQSLDLQKEFGFSKPVITKIANGLRARGHEIRFRGSKPVSGEAVKVLDANVRAANRLKGEHLSERASDELNHRIRTEPRYNGWQKDLAEQYGVTTQTISGRVKRVDQGNKVPKQAEVVEQAVVEQAVVDAKPEGHGALAHAMADLKQAYAHVDEAWQSGKIENIETSARVFHAKAVAVKVEHEAMMRAMFELPF